MARPKNQNSMEAPEPVTAKEATEGKPRGTYDKYNYPPTRCPKCKTDASLTQFKVLSSHEGIQTRKCEWRCSYNRACGQTFKVVGVKIANIGNKDLE